MLRCGDACIRTRRWGDGRIVQVSSALALASRDCSSEPDDVDPGKAEASVF